MSLHLAFGLLILLFWLRRLRGARRGADSLAAAPDAPGAVSSWPHVTLLVAAKDEEAVIDACLESLLRQDYPRFDVIAVDDRSSDRTFERLERAAARQPDKLRALRIGELPPGWAGKPHALARGVLQARGEWLLFTDADCRFAPEALRVSMGTALARRAELLSAMPRLRAEAWWERALQPLCVAHLMAWSRPHRAADARSSAAYANGQLILAERGCYDALGGHAAVRAELNEDLALARRAKQAGRRLLVIDGSAWLETRMYDSFARLCRGWSRQFYGCLATPGRVALALVVGLLLALAPAAGLMLTARAVAAQGFDLAGVTALGLWALALVVQHLAAAGLYARLGVGRAWALAFLPAALFVAALLGSAWFKAAGLARTTWRGTVYRAGAATGSAPRA